MSYKYDIHNRQVLGDLKQLLAKAGEHDIDRMVFRTTNAIKNYIIKNKLRGQVLHVRSGDLIGAFTISGSKAHYRLKNRVVYAAIHEYGGDIYPKTAKWLTFQTAKGWVRTKHVHIPERSYIRSAIDEKWDSILKLAAQYLWEEIEHGK